MWRIVVGGLVALGAGTWIPLLVAHPAPPGAVVVASAPLTSLDPLEASKADDLRLLGALFDPLTRLDPATGRAVPALAQSWTVDPQGRQWDFEIHAQARWSDGSPVTAAQVVEGLERHRQLGSAFSDLLAGVDRWEAMGTRVRITCRQPIPDLAERLAIPVFVPHHPHQGAWADPRTIVGNGPLRCQEWQIRHRLDLAPSATYAGPGPAQGPVRLRVVADPVTALRLYLDGQIDVIPSVTSDSARAITAAGLPGLQRSHGWGTELYRVRQGTLTPGQVARLSAAIDREALVRDLLDGFGSPAFGLVPGSRATAPDLAADPLPPLDLLVPAGRPDRLRVAEHLCAQWRRDLGVNVRVVTLPASELSARERQGAYALSRGSLLGDTPDALTFLAAFRSESGMNRTGWKDPTYDALLAAAAQPGPERSARLRQAEEHLLAAGVVIPLYHYAAVTLARPGVQGVQANPWELLHLAAVRK